MANKITHTQVYVLDQDEALDFYVGKLGFEVAADVDMGFMRWLTIHVPGDPDQAGKDWVEENRDKVDAWLQ